MYPYVDLARAWMDEAERRARAHRHVRAARAAMRASRRPDAPSAVADQRAATPGRAIDRGGT
jgi:hypothetical protein